uniref:Peptidase_M41 domain-containing protein n=1 Tax=Globodera pallida TaxID=36090 RepID=A0A183C6Q2_GLOPA
MVTAQIEKKWRRELRRANAQRLNNEARVSVHGAGHSLCDWLLPSAERFMRCTVVPTAEFDGATFTHPKDVFALSELRTEMVCLYGGKRAEMLFFDESIGHEGSDDLVVEGHAKKVYN